MEKNILFVSDKLQQQKTNMLTPGYSPPKDNPELLGKINNIMKEIEERNIKLLEMYHKLKKGSYEQIRLKLYLEESKRSLTFYKNIIF